MIAGKEWTYLASVCLWDSTQRLRGSVCYTAVLFNEGLWSIGIHSRVQHLWACAPGPSYLLSLSLSLSLTAFGTTLWYCHFHWTIQPNPHTHPLFWQHSLNLKHTQTKYSSRYRRVGYRCWRKEGERKGHVLWVNDKSRTGRRWKTSKETFKYWDDDSHNSVSVMRAWTRQLASPETPSDRQNQSFSTVTAFH